MPFPPEYLAPPAERMKREKKTKTPKNKKETTGKVREEKRKIRYFDAKTLFLNTPFVLDGTGNRYILPTVCNDEKK